MLVRDRGPEDLGAFETTLRKISASLRLKLIVPAVRLGVLRPCRLNWAPLQGQLSPGLPMTRLREILLDE
eukprot:14694629-Heterocapsa_arctica.AAC.1